MRWLGLLCVLVSELEYAVGLDDVRVCASMPVCASTRVCAST